MGSSESKTFSDSGQLSNRERHWSVQSWNAGSEEVQKRFQNYSFDSIGIWATPIRAKTGAIVGKIFGKSHIQNFRQIEFTYFTYK